MPFARSGNNVTVTGTEVNSGFITFCDGESDITVNSDTSGNTGRRISSILSNGLIFIVASGATLTLTDLTFDGLGFRAARASGGNAGGIIQFGNLREGVPVDPCVIILRSTRQGLGFSGGSGDPGTIRIYGGVVKTVGPNRTDILHRDVDGIPNLILNGVQLYREPGQTMTSAFYATRIASSGNPIVIKGFSAGFQNPTNSDLRAPIQFVDIADTGFYIWMASGRGENLRDIDFVVPSSRGTTPLITAKFKTSFIRGSIQLNQIAFDRENTATRDSNDDLTITKFYSITPKIVDGAGAAIEGAQIVIEEMGGEVISRTTDSNGDADEMLPREWHAEYSEQTGENPGNRNPRHYVPAVTHTHSHERLIYSYLHSLNHASSVESSAVGSISTFPMFADLNLTEQTKATVDAWTTIAIDHTAGSQDISITGAHTLDDLYDKVKADKSSNLDEPTYAALAATPVGNILDLTQNSEYDLKYTPASNADLTKGSKFVGIKGNLNAGMITIKIDAYGGTINNFRPMASNVAAQNCVLGRAGETTTCTFTSSTSGMVYVLDNVDMRNVTLSALTSGHKVIFVLRNGSQLPASLPTGYSPQTDLSVTVNLPTGITMSDVTTGLYTTDASGNYTVRVGDLNDLSFNSTDNAGLGTTVTNCRFVVAGGKILGVSRDFTVQRGTNTLNIDVVENLAFASAAPLNGASGTDVPRTVGGTDITDISTLVTYTFRSSDNKLLIEVQGFAAGDAPNASNVLTNRILGESKTEEEYLKSLAYYGAEVVRFAAQNQSLIHSGRYELANREASGVQKVTSIKEIGVDGVADRTSDVLNIETDASNVELVIALPNPTGASAAEIASAFISNAVSVSAEDIQTIAENTRDIVNTATGN